MTTTRKSDHDHDRHGNHDHHDHAGHSDHRRHGDHGHHHHHHASATGNIGFAFFLNFVFSLIEIVGGLWIGSVAVVADAVHDFGDSVALGVAWVLERFALKQRDESFNFGYKRFSLLSALVSGVVISVGSTLILIESVRRFWDQHTPAGGPMIALALLGVLVNAMAAFRLSRGRTHNEKVLTWHLIEDVMGWVLVLVGGIAIRLSGAAWIDPVLAIVLSVFVFYNVVRYLKSTAYLFLQGRPKNFDEQSFVTETLAVNGIEKVDHLAVWSLDGETSVLSARLHLHSVRDPEEIERLKENVRKLARKQQAVATLETCLADHPAHDSPEID